MCAQLFDMGFFRTVEVTNVELCRSVPGVTGPEDIQVVNGVAYISSDVRDWYDGEGTTKTRLAAQVRSTPCWPITRALHVSVVATPSNRAPELHYCRVRVSVP